MPLARNSKSAFVTVVLIKLSLISISFISASVTNKLLQTFEAVPKLNVSVMSGTRLLVIPATIDIVSVASSPSVRFPPIVTLPVTSKFPVISTLLFKLI